MSEDDERSQGRRRPGGGRGGFRRKAKTCAFCADKNLKVDYKQPDMLWRYLTERGKIRPRRQTGACARHQRQVALAIKRARHLALIPFAVKHSRVG